VLFIGGNPGPGFDIYLFFCIDHKQRNNHDLHPPLRHGAHLHKGFQKLKNEMWDYFSSLEKRKEKMVVPPATMKRRALTQIIAPCIRRNVAQRIAVRTIK